MPSEKVFICVMGHEHDNPLSAELCNLTWKAGYKAAIHDVHESIPRSAGLPPGRVESVDRTPHFSPYRPRLTEPFDFTSE